MRNKRFSMIIHTIENAGSEVSTQRSSAGHTPSLDMSIGPLVRARATGAVFARTVAEPPWDLRLGGSIQLSVHTVVRGRGFLWLDSPDSAVGLIPGSVTLVRGGPDHCIGHEVGAACLEPEEFRARHARLGPGDNPQATVLHAEGVAPTARNRWVG